jgi:hypothetical protein
MAALRALVVISLSLVEDMAHPTTAREYISMMVAR